ncbi:heparan-alpha-glucosaminide N-acetyltransferase domain-containing protein [Alloscardovia theropitheci]|nr:heparan-alpha-glucosaminide N-acetyltransferase domain-containing protein [Alloscardovia theropitheci]
MQQRIRYHVIDWIRGLALINMIAYHTLWDIAQLFPTPVGYNYTQFMLEPSVHVWQQSIGFTFLFVSGFCFCFGSKPLIRGTQLVLWGTLISIVTFIVLPNDPVRFGVLTVLGFGTLLLALIHAWSRMLPRIVSMCAAVLSLLIFTFMHDAQTGVVWGVQLPQWLYHDSFTAVLGFPPSGFISSDYYPIIPFFFVMLAGYFVYRSVEGTRAMAILTVHSRDFLSQFLEWIGRHSLIIYLLHQVIIFAIVRIIVFAIYGL